MKIRLKATDVISETTLIAYWRQVTGVPHPTSKDLGFVKSEIRKTMDAHPWVEYRGLIGVAAWAKDNQKRYKTMHGLVKAIPYAHESGYMPELDEPVSTETDLDRLLKIETDDEWRDRLIYAFNDIHAWQQTFKEWEKERGNP